VLRDGAEIFNKIGIKIKIKIKNKSKKAQSCERAFEN
jgi:hypothetical protein